MLASQSVRDGLSTRQNAVFQSISDPGIHFYGIPADRADAEAQRLRELALAHQAVKMRPLEPCPLLHLGAPQNSARTGWWRGCDLVSHRERSSISPGRQER